MRISALIISGVAFAALVIAQATNPRAPVIQVRPPGAAPTPTPVPDPTGVYVGSSTFTVEGSAGTFTQTWRIPIQRQTCSDCDAGQYFFHSTNFDGVIYQGGDVERGGVYGFLNPSGVVIDPILYAVNCSFINPSASAGYGQLYGGHFGEAPGTALSIRNGVLSGRLSGRTCFGRLLTADLSLRRDPSQGVQLCSARLSGSYRGTFANSCGGGGSGTAYVTRAGCSFGALLYDDFNTANTTVEGTITSPTTATFRLRFLAPCTGSGTGTATIQANGIVAGSYTGTSVCCTGQITGAFTLTP